MTRTLISVAVLVASSVLAQDAGVKLKGTRKDGAPKIDLNLPSFGAIPKGDDVKRVEEKPEPDRPTPKPVAGPEYTLVRVVLGKSFIKGVEGSKSATGFAAVQAWGNPLMTEKFATVVRVKGTKKRSAAITVAIVDHRGETLMESTGQLYFRGGDETEWQVDWDSTGIRRCGDFGVQVRVNEEDLGTVPFKIENRDLKEKDAG